MSDEKEIKAVLEKVTSAFSKLDMVGWSECFHPSRMIVTPDGVRSPVTQTECEQFMGTTIKFLRSKNFNKTVLDYCAIKMLTNYSAVVSVIWSRFDDEDKLIHSFGATYIFTKEAERWAISVLISHPKDVVVVGSAE